MIMIMINYYEQELEERINAGALKWSTQLCHL